MRFPSLTKLSKQTDLKTYDAAGDYNRGLITGTSLEDSLAVMNEFMIDSETYAPFNSKALPWWLYSQIAKTDPDIRKCITLWQANVDANGSTVQAGKNSKLAIEIHDLIYYDLEYSKLKNQVIWMVGAQGNALVMFNKYDLPVVFSAQHFNIYWDKTNQVVDHYAMIVNGEESRDPNLRNLKHGVDLWHFRDPLSPPSPISPGPVDALFGWLLLDNHALRSNNKFFSNGAVGTLLLSFEEKALEMFNPNVKDEQGKTQMDNFMAKVRQMISGVDKAHRVAHVPLLKQIFEAGKTNRDMQFLEIMQMATEKKARAYSVTMADMGKDVTYSNASTFNYALHDNIGVSFESEFDLFRNEFLLPHYGYITTGRVYVSHNPPKNPDDRAERQFWLGVWNAGGITDDEFREKMGLDPMPEELVIDPAIPPGITPGNKNQKVETGFFQSSLEQYNSRLNQEEGPIDRAWNSEYFYKLDDKDKDVRGRPKEKGFITRWKKAIKAQLNDYADKAKSYKTGEEALENLAKDMPKIESYYSFPTLKKDLLKFAGMGIDEFDKDMGKKTNQINYFSGEYPPAVVEFVESRTIAVLKGLEDYKGVDAATTQQISTLIAENISEPVPNLIEILLDKIPKMSVVRAEIIARSEVALAVEGSRNIMYIQENYGFKESLTIGDDRVSEVCLDNARQGRIGINKAFVATDTQFSPHHPRCRCTILYYPD